VATLLLKSALGRGIGRFSPALHATLKRALRTAGERVRAKTPNAVRMLGQCGDLVSGRALKEDWIDRWTGARDELTPPRRLLFDGTRSYAEFHRLGNELRRLLIAHGLLPHHHVLEVGSGNGKNARALTNYLGAGRYEGFDIVARGVAWCQAHITPRFPPFHFQHADIYNRTYNPTAKCRASTFHFPYPDNSSDFVFLTSVFTHMLPEDLGNYVAEIGRVLKPNGKCFASFFLLTADSLHGMDTPETGRRFPCEQDAHCRVADPDWPEDAVAYDESFVRGLFEKAGLGIEEVVHGSWWRGEANSQDHVWAAKRLPSSF
jgi:SAM-dependent methyltransferase